MADELAFRIGLAAIGVLAFVIQTYFGRRARPHQAAYALKRGTVGREGRLNFVVHAAFVFAMGAVIMLYVAAPATLRWSTVPLPGGLRWFGMALGVAGLIGLVEVHRQLGRYWSAYLELQENHQLITTGIYSRVRHPMYTVIIAQLVAMSLISANGLLMALAAGRILMFWVRMGHEEAMLTGQFGDQYRRYMQTTGRLLPRLRS
jgi:protein-S-isoprenylcysteine O-methyltransferase Ste14